MQLPVIYKENFNVSIESPSSGVTSLVTSINERLIKYKLTLFHRQGLTLANTLSPDSALGTQLPDFHLHLFYIKKKVDE
jgi:hypothetical protein